MDFADATYPSICLPFVHKGIRWQVIKEKIEGAGFGTVSRVDVASKKKGDKAFNIVFVHFEEWADTPEIKLLRTDLHSSPKFFGRLTIDEDGHYWKFTKSHVARPERPIRMNKKGIALADVDADLAKKYAEMAKLQKSIADLQAKRATLAMKLAAEAVPTTAFPATKQDEEDAADAVVKVDTTPTKPKRNIVVRAPKKSFKAALTHGRPEPIALPPMSPPTSPTATPPFTPPSVHRVDTNWADMAEHDAMH